MSSPLHGRGTAAEQGAAIRKQNEEREAKRHSSVHHTSHPHQQFRPQSQTSESLRSVPPPHASEQAAPPRTSGSRREAVQRRSRHGGSGVGGSEGTASPARSHSRRSAALAATSDAGAGPDPRAKRGSRSLRQKAAQEDDGKGSAPAKKSSSGGGAGAGLLGMRSRRGHDNSADEGATPQRNSTAVNESEAASEVDNQPKPRRRSKKTAAGAAGVGAGAAAAAAATQGRRHNYAKRQADEPVYEGEGSDADTSQSSAESDADVDSRGVAAGAGVGAAVGAASRTARRPAKLETKGRVYPLTGIDNVALLMEDAGYQTACFSVYLFKTVLDYETVHSFFERLADAYPKYRYVCELDPAAASKKDKAARKGSPASRTNSFDKGRTTRYSKSLKAGGPFRPARWRVDETFNLQDNIVVREASGRGDDDVLFDICGEVLSQHFDFSKPLWEATLVHGLHTSEGARSALMIKIHHAFSDGQGMIQSYHSAIAAMEAGVSIADKQTELDSKAAAAAKASQAKAKAVDEKQSSSQAPEQKAVGTRGVKPTVAGTISHSWHTIRGLYFRRREEFNYSDAEAKRSVKEMGGELSKNCRPSTRLYAHSDGIAMDDIKLVRKAFSTEKINLTLNDVASAILSRALRIAAEEMAKKTGRKVRDERVAVFIPISKRPKGDWTLANYTTGAIAWFRFHNPSHYGFEQLLQQVHREMNRIKKSYLPQWWFSWFNVICKRRAFQLPNYPVFRQIFQSAYREYHVFTNLPGPAKPVKFGEHEAFSYHVLPPSSPGRSTMAIGTISYAQDFSLAVSCDGTSSFKDKELTRIICRAFQEASQELVAAAKERLNFI